MSISRNYSERTISSWDNISNIDTTSYISWVADNAKGNPNPAGSSEVEN